MRRFTSLLLALLVSLTATAPLLAAQDPGQTGKDIQQACNDLVLDYAYYRDQLDADKLASLFTADAQLSVLGQTYVGREAIRERIVQSKRNAQSPATRHMMSTVRIFADDPDAVTGVSYVTVYAAVTEKFPADVQGFLALGEYHDQFVFTADGWKIAQRTFVPIFNSSYPK